MKCREHGDTSATFVCTHLQAGVACGYNADEDPDDRWPDAWCDACEDAFQQEGGEWNDSNSPKLAVLCTGCYERVRDKNVRVPPPITKGQVSLTDDELEAFVHACCERTKARQEQAMVQWKLDVKNRWLFDPERRLLRFYDVEGGPAVIADAVIAGSFSTKTETWMWAWGNEGYPEHARRAVDPVRVFGEVRGLERLSRAYCVTEEVQGWEHTQIAADLLGADAIYRAPMEHLNVFFLLSQFRIEHPS